MEAGMSTSMSNIKGIYEKVGSLLKYTYVADIANASTKQLKILSIPPASMADTLFSLISSAKDATVQTKKASALSNTHSSLYDQNLVFSTFNKMRARPYLYEIHEDHIVLNDTTLNASAIPIRKTFFASVLFETSMISDDNYILMHEDVNDICSGSTGSKYVGAIKLTSLDVISLGNNLYVTKLGSGFTFLNTANNDQSTLTNFPLPYFAIGKYENNKYNVISNSDLKLHDIAICVSIES
jgi:hypothetical protein